MNVYTTRYPSLKKKLYHVYIKKNKLVQSMKSQNTAFLQDGYRVVSCMYIVCYLISNRNRNKKSIADCNRNNLKKDFIF
jgi:hypothetical protein